MPSLQRLIGDKKRLSLVIVSALVIPLLFSLLMSALAAVYLSHGNISAASKTAKAASYPLRGYSALTFRLLPCLESWKHASLLVSETQVISADVVAATKPTDTSLLNIRELHAAVQKANQNLLPLNRNLQRRPLAWAAGALGRGDLLARLDTAAKQSETVQNILSQLAEEDQTWIVVLQNSDEIRAAGGFAGSYMVVPIVAGQVQEIAVEDIYDADGQFEGYLQPPPGVSEYLSSNNGLRLPDANWEAGFPESATQMMQFFALGNRQNVSGLMVINTPLVEDLFEIFGPIYVSDYDTSFESENFTELLRSERDDFFPGSIQKKHLLSLLINQLKFEINDLGATEYLEISEVFGKHAAEKNVMLYSRHPELQQSFAELSLAGSLNTYGSSDFLYLIESNVGINKANKKIERQVEIAIADENALITINFQNNNLPPTQEEMEASSSRAPHNGYANYQRLVFLPHWQVESVKVGGNLIDDYDLNIIKNDHGEEFQQLGFLVTVKEQNSQTVEVEFSRQTPPSGNNQLTMLKQPGLKPFKFTIATPEKSNIITLNSDKIIDLKSVTILP